MSMYYNNSNSNRHADPNLGLKPAWARGAPESTPKTQIGRDVYSCRFNLFLTACGKELLFVSFRLPQGNPNLFPIYMYMYVHMCVYIYIYIYYRPFPFRGHDFSEPSCRKPKL